MDFACLGKLLHLKDFTICLFGLVIIDAFRVESNRLTLTDIYTTVSVSSDGKETTPDHSSTESGVLAIQID